MPCALTQICAAKKAFPYSGIFAPLQPGTPPFRLGPVGFKLCTRQPRTGAAIENPTLFTMKRVLTPTSKVERHGEGVGPATDDDIEQRAKELARIAGRKEVTDDDRANARAEFLDRNLPDPVNEDAESMQSRSRDPSDPPVERGRQAPEYMDVDEKTNLERLALEGVEEAQHDQMMSARQPGTPPSQRRRPKN
jgi:hypothetical protein